jgi:hypothetical protein
MPMTREELTALRDAIDITLALPDSIREMLAQWLAPAAAKPNGQDPHPPPIAPKLNAAKALVAAKDVHARAAEQKLLAVLRDHPGSSAGSLARASGGALSSTKHRLARLAERGQVEKDAAGRWRLKGEEPRPPTQGEAPGPQQPSPN